MKRIYERDLKKDLKLTINGPTSSNAHTYLKNKGQSTVSHWNENVNLFTWQKHLMNDIQHYHTNLLIDAATSTGKTFMSVMLAVFATLSTDDRKLLILLPTNSTLEEVAIDIYKWHFLKGNDAGILASFLYMQYDDTKDENLLVSTWKQHNNSQIIVTTYDAFSPAPLATWLQTAPKKLTLILDEAHLPQTPVVLESIEKDAGAGLDNVILLSATLSQKQKDYYASKLPNMKIIQERMRPLPIQEFLFTPTEKRGKKVKIATPLSTKLLNIEPVYASDLTTADIARLGLSVPKTRDQQYELSQKIFNKDNPDYKKYTSPRKKIMEHNEAVTDNSITKLTEPVNLYSIISAFTQKQYTPTLLVQHEFSDLKKTVIDFAKYIQNLLDSDPEVKEAERKLVTISSKKQTQRSDEKDRLAQETELAEDKSRVEAIAHKYLIQSFELKVPPDSKMPQWLRDVTAENIYIYSDHREIPAWYRKIVLEAFRKRNIPFLFTDKSLVTGINLPVKGVIVLDKSTENLTEEEEGNYRAFFYQAIGRAGRYGKDDYAIANSIIEYDQDQQVPETARTVKPPEATRNVVSKSSYDAMLGLSQQQDN